MAPELDPATVVVAAGRPEPTQGAPVNPPIVLSSTYASTGEPAPKELFYARVDTETWQPLEHVLGVLEGSPEPAVLLGSGMAAVAAAMSVVPGGGRIVAPRHCYGVTLVLAEQLRERFGVRLDLVDIADDDDVRGALRAHPTDLLWVESPSNPLLEVADLPVLVAAARDAGALVAVDNTFATPLGQRPLELGADLVVHSVSKYLAGHSDVILGAVVAASAELRDQMHSYRTVHGAVAGPVESWLALRGVRTLALRVERSSSSALELARRLAEHPAVAEVRYPGLPGDPGHERAARQMSNFGSIVALRPRGGAAAAEALTRSTTVWTAATSLGGVESTLERRRRIPTESAEVPEDLVRLSVGIEAVEDLWADLDAALRAATV